MEVVCSCCGKVFNKKPSRVGTVNYCSMACVNASKFTGVNKPCDHCGKMMYVKNSSSSRSLSGNNFCSRSCATAANNTAYRSKEGHPLWAGGATKYRALAFSELPRKCARCDYAEVVDILQVHHKDRDRRNNAVDNLELLCPTCHVLEHFNAKDGWFTPTKT